jgi:hypothetical protein
MCKLIPRTINVNLIVPEAEIKRHELKTSRKELEDINRYKS